MCIWGFFKVRNAHDQTDRFTAKAPGGTEKESTPILTPSMRIALSDLGLERIRVIYPGEKRYSLAKNIEVVPIRQLYEI